MSAIILSARPWSNDQPVDVPILVLERTTKIDTKAAGWLAHAHAWVHPFDLTATFPAPPLSAVGAGHRALPQTYVGTTDHRD